MEEISREESVKLKGVAMYGRIHMKKFQKWLDVLVERVRGFPKVE